MFKRIIDFFAEQWAGVVICMVITLFIFWSIGFFCNGLLGTHFELSSVWAGVTAISAAGVVGLGKYWTDSKHNSESGQKPNTGSN